MKVVVTDLDGTLLNSSHFVSEKNLETLKKIQEEGYEIIFASGRVSSSVEYIMKNAGINGYIVANNGALVLDKEKKVVYKQALDHEQIEKILDVVETNGIKFNMYDKEKYYCNQLDRERVSHLFKYGSDKDYQIDIVVKDDIGNFVKDRNLDIFKVQMTIPENVQEDVIKELSKIDNIYIAKSGKCHVEAMNKSVNKWNGIEIALKDLGGKVDKIISIGDYENDLPMIVNADIGIAMGNANDKVKSKSDLITETNEEDGFSKAINKILF